MDPTQISPGVACTLSATNSFWRILGRCSLERRRGVGVASRLCSLFLEKIASLSTYRSAGFPRFPSLCSLCRRTFLYYFDIKADMSLWICERWLFCLLILEVGGPFGQPSCLTGRVQSPCVAEGLAFPHFYLTAQLVGCHLPCFGYLVLALYPRLFLVMSTLVFGQQRHLDLVTTGFILRRHLTQHCTTLDLLLLSAISTFNHGAMTVFCESCGLLCVGELV